MSDSLKVAADTLFKVTAADTTGMVAGVNSLFAGWGLPPQVAATLATLLLGLPTSLVVLLTRVPVFKWLAPPFHALLDPVWERNKTWALPLIALAVGWLGTGSPLVGAAAVLLHQTVTGIYRAAKGTAATVDAGRVGAGLLVLALALACAGPARAATSPAPPLLSVHRLVGTLAVGETWTGTDALALVPAPYARPGLGYQLAPFLQLNVGARRPFTPAARWVPEAELRLIWRP